MILDNVEVLLGNFTDDEFSSTLKSVLSYELHNLKRKILVIGITVDKRLVDPMWLSMFSNIHTVTMNQHQRLQLLCYFSRKILVPSSVLDHVSAKTNGFTAADLQKVAQVALLGGWEKALAETSASMALEFQSKVPIRKLGELVGIDSQIHLCKSSLGRVLVCGPTGCGKTHLAIGLAQESGLNYILINGATIRSKYVGQSEKNLVNVFERARKCAPSIIVIDHIDNIIRKRHHEETRSISSENTDDRLIACFLAELDAACQVNIIAGKTTKHFYLL